MTEDLEEMPTTDRVRGGTALGAVRKRCGAEEVPTTSERDL
jgi:hypothetical protein